MDEKIPSAPMVMYRVPVEFQVPATNARSAGILITALLNDEAGVTERLARMIGARSDGVPLSHPWSFVGPEYAGVDPRVTGTFTTIRTAAAAAEREEIPEPTTVRLARRLEDRGRVLRHGDIEPVNVVESPAPGLG